MTRVAPPARGRAGAWTVLGALAGVAVVGTTFIDPILPLVLLAGAIAVLLAALRPKLFAAIGVVLIALAVPIEHVVGSFGSYTDEAVVAVAFVAFTGRRIASGKSLIWLPGSWWFGVWAIFALVSSALHQVPLADVAAAGYIAIKGVLLAFALAQLEWSRRDLRNLTRLGVGALVVIAVTVLLNLLIPGTWAALTTGTSGFRGLAGLPAVNGPFQHPAALSRFCVILAVAALAWACTVRASAGAVVAIAGAAVIAVLTFQSKSLVGLVVVAVLLLLRFARARGWVALICLAPLAVAVALPPAFASVFRDVQSYVVPTSARGRLTLGAVDLAQRDFPFGAGLARWGDSQAASSYSPEYVAAGFQTVFGLGPGKDGQFLNDTQWSAIIGEAGWFGAAAFTIGLLCMLWSMVRPTSVGEAPEARWIRTTGILWMVALLIESLVAPVFVSTPSFPFLFAGAGIVASIRVNGLHGGEARRRTDPARAAAEQRPAAVSAR